MELSRIQPYIEKGLISEQIHPLNSDIRIYNYTHKCQWEKAWDEVTTTCRGLILDVKNNKVLARPFPKFFNYGEDPNVQIPPNETPIITEKYDGSLGILYWLPGDPQPWIATRGSFTSDQAQWATRWLRKQKTNFGWSGIPKDYTFLFEIIYLENRIVVNYDKEGLILLGIINIRTGVEILPTRGSWGHCDTIPWAEGYPGSTIDKLKGFALDNKEGFVVHYPFTGLRLKVKFDEYVRLHRIMTGFSVKTIWESLRDNKPLSEVLVNVPDEFYQWAKKEIDNLTTRFNNLNQLYTSIFLKTIQDMPEAPRKDIALAFSLQSRPGILFAMLDKKDYKSLIWKLLKPQNHKVFKVEY